MPESGAESVVFLSRPACFLPEKTGVFEPDSRFGREIGKMVHFPVRGGDKGAFCLRFCVGWRWRGAPVFRGRFVTGRIPVPAGREPSKTGAEKPVQVCRRKGRSGIFVYGEDGDSVEEKAFRRGTLFSGRKIVSCRIRPVWRDGRDTGVPGHRRRRGRRLFQAI